MIDTLKQITFINKITSLINAALKYSITLATAGYLKNVVFTSIWLI